MGRLLAAAALALALVAGPVRAQLYDPGFRWRTLETPHFRVHFHQGEDALAQEVARIAERAHATLVPLLGHAPRARTEVVLSDDVDDANGSATPLPRNTMRLFAAPPSSLSELNDYRDWMETLVFHEYVHILHLDLVGGLPAAGNAVFGRLFFPNALVPGWMVEGLAVLHEAPGPAGAGRNASAIFDMYARALATEPPGFPTLAEATNPFLEWPLGTVPYLLGGRFMAFLQAQHGPQAIAGFLADQGAQAWPYAPSWAGRRWFGADFPELWARYAEAERTRFDAQLAWIRSRPVTRPALLTAPGGRLGSPRYTPDGASIVYFRRDLDRRPGLFRVPADGGDPGRVANVEGNGALALASPHDAVVAISEVWREHRIYDDLWRVELATGARRRLTDGARATAPAIAPDGAIVHVRRGDGGALSLVRMAADGSAPEVLFGRPGAQVFSPAVSPDGRRIAFELHEDGRRDLAVWEDGRVVRLTDDDALDTDPHWTPDGSRLLFASDRGGVFNLHARDEATGAIHQVTNVESGAFQPQVSPDGRTIAFVTYGRGGYALGTIPFDPSSWLAPVAPPAAVERVAAEADPLPTWRYRALDTLAPTSWFPVIGRDGAGPIYGAVTGGSDVLARHAWALQAWWSVDGGQPGYAASYLGGWSWPQLDLASSRFLDSAPGGTRGLEAVFTPLAAGLNLSFTRLSGVLSLRLGWSGTDYDVLGEERSAPVPELLGVGDGFLSELSFRAVYTDARRFVRSISPEEGRTVALVLAAADPSLGSDFGVARARLSWSEYLRLPGTRHGVLALRLAGGLADGSIGGRAPFRLGGTAEASPLSLVLLSDSTPSDQLRGYPHGSLRGTGFVLGNAELRFPLARPETGRSTWPLFLRRVHGAVFADLGDAYDLPGELPFAGHPLALERLRLGAGAEVRLEVVLGYRLVTDVRLGVAHPFGRVFQGETRGRDAATTVYVAVGQSF